MRISDAPLEFAMHIEDTAEDQTPWRRSSYCSHGACVEVALDGDLVLVRDSKESRPRALRFTREEWQSFVAGVKDGRFDIG
jgi:predicted secreted Zn-dependent protease